MQTFLMCLYTYLGLVFVQLIYGLIRSMIDHR
jgi:hypothetical protein